MPIPATWDKRLRALTDPSPSRRNKVGLSVTVCTARSGKILFSACSLNEMHSLQIAACSSVHMYSKLIDSLSSVTSMSPFPPNKVIRTRTSESRSPRDICMSEERIGYEEPMPSWKERNTSILRADRSNPEPKKPLHTPDPPVRRPLASRHLPIPQTIPANVPKYDPRRFQALSTGLQEATARHRPAGLPRQGRRSVAGGLPAPYRLPVTAADPSDRDSSRNRNLLRRSSGWRTPPRPTQTAGARPEDLYRTIARSSPVRPTLSAASAPSTRICLSPTPAPRPGGGRSKHSTSMRTRTSACCFDYFTRT